MSNSIDLDKYKNPNETEKEWRLKSQFIERFQDKFEEDRLICLAQCYVNVETMGCRYSNDLMKQIKELTADFKKSDNNEQNNRFTYSKTQQPKQKKQLYQEIKFVKSNTIYNNNTKQSSQQQQQQQPTKQIQILSRNKPIEQKPKQTNIQFQTVTQINQSKSNSFIAASPPKTYNFASAVKSSPNQPKPVNNFQTPKTNSKPNGNLACPSSTTEQSPAPNLVPIPFGLATPDSFTSSHSVSNIKLDFNDTQSMNPSVNSLFTNASLKQEELATDSMLTFNTFNKSNPLSILINSSTTSDANQSNNDAQFQKLTKLNKLRNAIRSDPKLSQYILMPQPNTVKDIIEYFKQLCLKYTIKLDYVQYVATNDLIKTYTGEIYLESFRLIKVQDTKRKRCALFAHKKALHLLHGTSELAVRIAPTCKRDLNMKLDNNNNSNTEIEFEYELYLVNSDQNATTSYNIVNEMNVDLDDDCEDDEETVKQNENHIFHLNTMLRSLLLPNAKTVSNDVVDNTLNDDDENEDDDNDDTNTSITKKTRVREAIPNFCIFLTGNESATLVHDRNSISILTNSCIRSSYGLEFELKIKGQQLSIKMQLDDSEEDEECNETSTKKKYKCKCLINHVKISSAHGKTKIECKRQAALKAITFLSKIFPVLQDTSYQTEMQQSLDYQQEQYMSLPAMHISTSTSSNPTQQRYFKISKEDLFKGLVPPTLFETLSNNLANSSLSSDLGSRLLFKMGWKGQGHGLGRTQQGITQPIELEVNKLRLGLGCPYYMDEYAEELKELDKKDSNKPITTNTNNNNNYKTYDKRNRYQANNMKKDYVNNIINLLRNFTSSPAENDLVFEKSLSTDDRKIIHREANRLGLKTRSEGSGDDRFLVVKKKRTTNELVEAAKLNGGQISSFKLISGGEDF